MLSRCGSGRWMPLTTYHRGFRLPATPTSSSGLKAIVHYCRVYGPEWLTRNLLQDFRGPLLVTLPALSRYTTTT